MHPNSIKLKLENYFAEKKLKKILQCGCFHWMFLGFNTRLQ